MGSLNIISLIGRVGKDPEIRTIGSGSKVASFSLATTDYYKDKSGNKKEETQWHNIECWGALADLSESYIRKGGELYAQGKLVYQSYEKDGTKHTVTKIKAEKIVLLGGKRAESVVKEIENTPAQEMEPDNDLPF